MTKFFQTGKQYIRSTYITTCVYINDKTALLEHDDLSITNVNYNYRDNDGWVEYREPITITKYAYIIELLNGDIHMDDRLYDTEEDAREDALSEYHWDLGKQKLIAIIPVTWVQEQ